MADIHLTALQKRLVVDRLVLPLLKRAGISATIQPTDHGIVLTIDTSDDAVIADMSPTDRKLVAMLQHRAKQSP